MQSNQFEVDAFQWVLSCRLGPQNSRLTFVLRAKDVNAGPTSPTYFPPSSWKNSFVHYIFIINWYLSPLKRLYFSWELSNCAIRVGGWEPIRVQLFKSNILYRLELDSMLWIGLRWVDAWLVTGKIPDSRCPRGTASRWKISFLSIDFFVLLTFSYTSRRLFWSV